jgi:arginine/lysine/ornithine decarboxylase
MMKVSFQEKNLRRKAYNPGTPGHKEGRSLRKQALYGAFGDKDLRADANIELMILGTIRDK